MGERNVVNPKTGETGSVSESKLARAQAAGARELRPEERAQILEERKHDADIVESHIAGYVGKARGVGEAFGMPTDAAVTSVADVFGKGDETRAYLNDLRKWHPYASGAGELAGQVAGTVAGGELLGGGGLARAPTAAGRIAQGAASSAVRGGLENLVIGSTHDVNEASLGNADANGEKLLAQMPKHFVLGAGLGALAGGGGAALGEAASALQRPVSEALDRQATAAVGRELGGDAALGAQIRGRFGGAVPESRASIADVLAKEQGALREASRQEALGARSALEGQHTTAAWQQAAKTEATKLASAREAQAAVKAVESRHVAAREALQSQHAEATSTLGKLTEEKEVVRKQLRSLAGDLDKVKGAELPSAQNIMRVAKEALQPVDSLTPPSPKATQIFNEWTATFSKKHGGKLSFSDLQEAIDTLGTLEKRQRVVSGWGSDPEVKRAIDALKRSAKAEFDRASEVTAASVSEAKGLHAAQLRARLPELDKALEAAEGHLGELGGAIKDFERGAAQELRQAEREGFASMRAQSRVAGKEERVLAGQHRAEFRGLPKEQKTTAVDSLLDKARQPQEPGGLGTMGLLGAGASLLHGNVAGAAMSLAGGLGAQAAKARGNLLAARTLASLAEQIAKADGSIARVAGRAVGRYVRQGAEVASDDRAPARPRITFEKAAQRVRDAQANPLIIEQRVRTMSGPWATTAPSIYSSMLASSLRMQEFLASKLPAPRRDPYSLTPHLEPDELSDSEKYDFVEYVRACDDPIKAMRDVIDGNGSPQQVEAVAAVYPQMYAQAKAEVLRHIAALGEPLEYERAINIGTLLQIDTNEVMTGEFQSMLADMYSARAEEEKIEGGSKPRGVNSRLSKSMSSASQQMQMGDV